jgi:hypothetical protein
MLILFLAATIATMGCISQDGTVTQQSPSPVQTLKAATTVPTLIQTATGAPAATEVAPDPFPDALAVGQKFTYGQGTQWTSEATLYRVWINDTYRWFSPEYNTYQAKTAPSGKKYCILFLDFVNTGTARAPIPAQNGVVILYDNAMISPDPSYPLPSQNPDSTPRISRIGEIEFVRKLANAEYIEDFGYAHGQKLGYLSPGKSNAVDGYILYEVPGEMAPDKAYVRIALPGTDTAIWKRA